MPNCNSVTLMGNCTRDPELRQTPGGAKVCEIGLAISHKYTTDDGQKREDTTWVDVTLWSRLAEIAAQYLHKGAPVFIQGRLQTDSWDDKQTGQKRTKLKVVAENLHLLTVPPNAQAPAPTAPKPASPAAAASTTSCIPET